MEADSFHFAMLSHPGRVRRGNEDTCAANVSLGAFVVCDGMGGAAAGEIASQLAADTFLHSLAPDDADTPRMATADVRLEAAIHAANQEVFDHSRRSPELRGMGTTLVALLLQRGENGGPPSLTLAHVGDSRCYRFRAGALEQLTEDHSLVEEKLRAGEISASEAETHPMRNIITRAVGSQPFVEPEIRHLEAESGDLFLLASDGLTRELADADIAATLLRAQARARARGAGHKRQPGLNVRRLCQTLIDQANDAGGGDNITVLLLQIP